MDASDLDLEALDAKVETEQQCLVSTLQRIADRFEALSSALGRPVGTTRKTRTRGH